MRKRRARSAKLNRDLLDGPVHNPPTTKKHQALVELRRQTAGKKLVAKQDGYAADYVRGVKAVRLAGRVKQSPVFVNNTNELKQKRTNSIQRFRDQTQYLERVYQQQKAIMEFNVANRPLLFEQQTQEFINLYNQIRDLQKYVAILRNQNLDPNDYLTDNQKILLQRAQYFDQLNQLAYFPGGIPAPQGEITGPTSLDEQQLQQMQMLQQQDLDQMQMQSNGHMPVDMAAGQQQYLPQDHYEQVNLANAAAGLTTKSQQYQMQAMDQMDEDMQQQMDMGEAVARDDEYGEEQDEGDDPDQDERQNNEPEIVDDVEHQMGDDEDEQEMVDGMQMMQDADEDQGDDGEGQEDDDDGEDDEEKDMVAMDGHGGEELVHDGEENEDESPQAEGEDDDVDDEVQAYAQQRMEDEADDDEQMMGEGEDDEGDDGSMGGEEMYDVTDPEQLYDHVLQMQQQNMHIEQHDPTGAHAQLAEELGYRQMHGYEEGDDGEGDYGEDDDGLALENDYGQDDDGGVMMYQQDVSRGNANM